MDERERFFVNNYSFFGESSKRRCKYVSKKSEAIKDKYKKKGVYLLPIKEFAETNAPVKKGNKNIENAFTGIQFAVASLDQIDQDQVIELAKNIPNPNILIDQAIAIQQYRIKIGLQNEYDQGRLLDNTEVAISNLVNMIQAKNTIEEGQEINLNVSNSITALLDEIEDDDDSDITIDVDKENKKEQIKEIHTKSINDYLDEA